MTRQEEGHPESENSCVPCGAVVGRILVTDRGHNFCYATPNLMGDRKRDGGGRGDRRSGGRGRSNDRGSRSPCLYHRSRTLELSGDTDCTTTNVKTLMDRLECEKKDPGDFLLDFWEEGLARRHLKPHHIRHLAETLDPLSDWQDIFTRLPLARSLLHKYHEVGAQASILS